MRNFLHRRSRGAALGEYVILTALIAIAIASIAAVERLGVKVKDVFDGVEIMDVVVDTTNSEDDPTEEPDPILPSFSFTFDRVDPAAPMPPGVTRSGSGILVDVGLIRDAGGWPEGTRLRYDIEHGGSSGAARMRGVISARPSFPSRSIRSDSEGAAFRRLYLNT